MKALYYLSLRTTKLFLRDKGRFIGALVSPMVLLVLYASFLGDVYRRSFANAFPPEAAALIPEKLLDGMVSSQLISSLLAVCCITVPFSVNTLLVTDRADGMIKDLTVSPVKRPVLALGYYISTALTSMLVCLITLGAGLLYIRGEGWYMSAGDMAKTVLDVFLLVMLGTALSSAIYFFLSAEGQMVAMSMFMYAGYGFLCGAYMPIASFGEGLQKALSFLPGTYGTSLLRSHLMGGCFEELSSLGFPDNGVDELRAAFDCRIEFFGSTVGVGGKYIIIAVTIAVLMTAYAIMNVIKGRRAESAGR